MRIETRYKVGDEVWFMKAIEPSMFKIQSININISDWGISYACIDDEERTEDDYSAPTEYDEEEVFATKEDLLVSLFLLKANEKEYIAKEVKVKAVQYNGDNGEEIAKWAEKHFGGYKEYCFYDDILCLYFEKGEVQMENGDFLVDLGNHYYLRLTPFSFNERFKELK